ncbi:MAG: hypothetical protein GC159_22785 [Phycisphaera sp.]|nr:hypothetical protein [Phycisphaera sp.]
MTDPASNPFHSGRDDDAPRRGDDVAPPSHTSEQPDARDAPDPADTHTAPAAHDTPDFNDVPDTPLYTPPTTPPRRRSIGQTLAARDYLVVSRTLMFGWCAWLLCSWAVNLTIDAPRWVGSYGNMQPGDLYIPAVRGMMQSILLGMTVAWPAWRLSERVPPNAPVGGQVLIDLASLLLVTQVVLWPLQHVVDWAFEQTVLSMMVLLVWSTPVAMAVWVGRLRGTVASRTAAMAACLTMLIAGWACTMLGWPYTTALWSPTTMLWTLSGRVTITAVDAIAGRLMIIAGLSAAGWGVLRLTLARRRSVQ